MDAPKVEPFLKFLQHIKDISQYLKAHMADDGNNMSFWTSPLRINNSLLVGLQAKIKTEGVRIAVLACSLLKHSWVFEIDLYLLH